jgi:hypothetical protein
MISGSLSQDTIRPSFFFTGRIQVSSFPMCRNLVVKLGDNPMKKDAEPGAIIANGGFLGFNHLRLCGGIIAI